MNTPQQHRTSANGADWSGPQRRRGALRLLCGLLFCALWGIEAREVEASKECQLKAAFLYNFTKFVEWPANRFADDSAPIVIGIFGRNSVGVELHQIVKDHRVNGREIVVKQVDAADQAAGCHMLFFGAASDGSLAKTLAAMRNAAVLTVGESDQFGAAGGMINFVLEGDKVRFEINAAQAEKAGLKISSQLLKLARKAPNQK